MNILYSIIGNICAGKTSILDLISKEIDTPFFSIDEFRIKHNAVLISGEWDAWDDLTSCIKKENIAVLESSGLSGNLTDIYSLFDKVIIILIDCKEDILIKRLENRNDSNYKNVPFFGNRKNESLISKIQYFNNKIGAIKYDYKFDSSNNDINSIANNIIQIINKKTL